MLKRKRTYVYKKHVGKSKPVLRERGLTIPRQKSSDMLSLSSLKCTCKKFSKQPRENLGIENVVP
jgi:hypothetical protein